MTSLFHLTARTNLTACCAGLLLTAACGCQSLPQTFPTSRLAPIETATLQPADFSSTVSPPSGEIPEFDSPAVASESADGTLTQHTPSTSPDSVQPEHASGTKEELPAAVASTGEPLSSAPTPPATGPAETAIVAQLPAAGEQSTQDTNTPDNTTPVTPGIADASSGNSVTSGSETEATANSTSAKAVISGMPELTSVDNRLLAQVDAGTQTDVPIGPETPPVDVAGSSVPKSLQFAMKPPGALLWQTSGKTAGGRSFQVATAGDEGFHTLIIGSAVGHEPAAIRLTERLATHLHENSLILGGFRTTILRTLNPDGEAILKSVNGNGDNVNRSFPVTAQQNAGPSVPEAAYLLQLLNELRPQRVIHLRTIPGQRGAIGSDQTCREKVKQIADAGQLKQFAFPEDINSGTLEFYLSSFSPTQIITVAIPADLNADSSWEQYEDLLLNLIQQDPVKTQRGQQQAAGLSEE